MAERAKVSAYLKLNLEQVQAGVPVGGLKVVWRQVGVRMSYVSVRTSAARHLVHSIEELLNISTASLLGAVEIILLEKAENIILVHNHSIQSTEKGARNLGITVEKKVLKDSKRAVKLGKEDRGKG